MIYAENTAATIRVDANNFWDNAEAALSYLKILRPGLLAVKEPLQVGDRQGLNYLAKSLSLPVILDESFVQNEQLTALADHPER